VADRNIRDVIQQILELIPESFSYTRERLNKISRDAGFRAPEVMYESWGEIAETLQAMSDGEKPTKEWQIRICEIITTKTREELGLKVE
jgi:hypothetical protein